MTIRRATLRGKNSGAIEVLEAPDRSSPHHAIGGRDGMAKQKRTTEERFWSKVDKSGDCWLWTGGTFSYGYGQFDRLKRAHRVSYELAYGPIPPKMFVCHKCDVRRCVNPEHLFVGDWRANNHDMFAKQRHRVGSQHRNSKLVESDVRQIIELLNVGETRASIARRFGVDWEVISRIKKGTAWVHVARRSLDSQG